LFVLKQAAARIGRLADSLTTQARRLDFRHRREAGSRRRKQLTDRSGKDDDGPVLAPGLAWA